MKNLATPNIDAVLLEEGYVRPNEAPLWVKKHHQENSPFISGAKLEYKIVFDIGDCLISMENWFNLPESKTRIEELKKSVSRCANSNICITYTVEKDLFAFILLLTADCYYHMPNKEAQEMDLKYRNLFEKFTGLKWK